MDVALELNVDKKPIYGTYCKQPYQTEMMQLLKIIVKKERWDYFLKERWDYQYIKSKYVHDMHTFVLNVITLKSYANYKLSDI